MSSFVWGSHFETDIKDVDSQHHRLVDLINNFGKLLLHDDLDMQKVEATFEALADYSHYHFGEEELLMSELNIDTRHADAHIVEHKSFLEDVTSYHQNGTISRDNATQLHQYLVHWLAYHILGSDQNMARQIRAIRQGTPPNNAFDSCEWSASFATEPLLAALGNLFTQVSQRNRELKELNNTLEQKVAIRTQKLIEANEQLEIIALTDALTSLPNRRHAMRQLQLHWDESKKEETQLCCLMIDADGFKQVNDTWGHDAGDVVLKELALTLQHTIRTDDIACRLGGDEFLIICPSTDLKGGMHLGQNLCETVAGMKVKAGDGFWHGSVSIGVGVSEPTMSSMDSLLKAADEGVYRAKEDGRNCVRRS